MLFMKKDKPLLKCEVLHSVPGRIRIGCRALQYLYEYKQEIEKNILDIEYIKKTKVENITSNVLIYYNMDIVDADEVKEIVESIIATYSIPAYQKERKEKNKVVVKENRIEEEDSGKILKRLALTAGSLVGSKVVGETQLIPWFGRLSKFTTFSSLASIYLSKPIMLNGAKSLINAKRPNADTLTAASIIVAIITGRGFSALATILLSDIAEYLTVHTMTRTKKAVKDMLDVGEKNAWKVKEDGNLVSVPLSQVKADDLLMYQTGDKISVDGVIKKGSAVIDQSMITGEFMPVNSGENSKVFAGTIIKSGSICVQAEKVGKDTTVSKIIDMVDGAAENKAQIQTYADKFSAKLIPMNFLLAGLIYITTKNVNRALNMLIIDYSCGVRLSTATALSATIFTAARNGVLLKGGNIVEGIAEADTILLDKTGTMTEGKPKLVSVVTAGNVAEKEIIELAAAAEETSTHPLAYPILTKLKKSGYNIPKHTDNIVHVARGVETSVDGNIIRVGNVKFMKENNIKMNSVEREAEHLIERGENIVFVAKNNKILGVLGVHDTLRDNMKKSINRLRYLGFDDVKLLTGDLASQARVVANSMALDSYESELLPEDKAKYVLKLQENGSKVIMVGDGVNDAPALAYANVGVTIGGTRTDIAIEASDVTITNDNPLLLPYTVTLSRKAMSIVKQNFAATVGVNTVALLLGAGGVLPVFWGSVIHNLTTIIVIGNSSRVMLMDSEDRR